MIRLANLLPMMERWRQTSMELFTDATILPAGPTSISRRIEELQYHCSKEPVKKREKSKEKRLRNKYLDVFPLCLVIGRLSDENEFPTKKKKRTTCKKRRRGNHFDRTSCQTTIARAD